MSKKSKEKQEIKLNSERISIRERRIKTLKLVLLISLLFLISIYFILRVVYANGAFTVSLDEDFSKKSGIIIFESLEQKESRRVLEAQRLENMDNISMNWIPQNIDTEAEGGHNGPNYIAYTFYVQNQGSKPVNYWYQVVIDDIIKGVDEAIRVMVYQNGERKIYAKLNSNGNPEENTTPFYSDKYLLVEQRQNIGVDEIDKYTIVIWLEGDDPDCVDAIIGGEMKMHLEITEEHKE